MSRKDLVYELIERDNVEVFDVTNESPEWVSFFDLALNEESGCKVRRAIHVRNAITVAFFWYPDILKGHVLVRDNRFNVTELYSVKEKNRGKEDSKNTD